MWTRTIPANSARRSLASRRDRTAKLRPAAARRQGIDRHGRMIMRLLPALGDDPATYDADLVRRVILAEVQRSSRPYVKTMTTALRGYLNSWPRTEMPAMARPGNPDRPPMAAVSAATVSSRRRRERPISSCDLSKPHGIRDRAILLLLARLGLRAGDILDMRLDDIAWADGTLRVPGKGRREIQLPLPQDAGDALLGYLERLVRALPVSTSSCGFGTTPTFCSVVLHLRRNSAGAGACRNTRRSDPRRQSPAAFRSDQCCARARRWTRWGLFFGTAPRIRQLTTPRSTWPCSGRWHSAGRGASHAER